MNRHNPSVDQVEFLAALVRKRYPFRPLWAGLCWRMLSWGLSAALILHIFETCYTQRRAV